MGALVRLSAERNTTPIVQSNVGAGSSERCKTCSLHKRLEKSAPANEESRFEPFCKGQALSERVSQQAISPLSWND